MLDERMSAWNKEIRRLDEVTDRLGKPIDEGIKASVAAFAMHAFPVRSSCEGHVEERYGKKMKLRPYIDIGFTPPEQRFIGEMELRERVAAEFGVLAGEIDQHDAAEERYWDCVQELRLQETPEYVLNREKNKALRRQVAMLLEAFYQNRRTPDDTKLILENVGPTGRFGVTTARENPTEVLASEVEGYRQQLMAEQEEMRAFAEFLKKKFFDQAE